MRSKRRLASVLFGCLGLLLTTAVFIDEAHAIIGRPLTPVSYAGVARRTVRRSVYY
jgi:hypothetical protein